MAQQSLMVGLRAETAIHAGTGESDGVVDLPIMRESHTGWPVVFGSAVKGALRAAATQRLDDENELFAMFGPDTTSAGDHAGSLMVTDARLIALPVRSLTSQYRLVTCPDLIRRLERDLARLGIAQSALAEFAAPADDEVLVTTATTDASLFLEEFAFSCRTTELDSLLQLLAEIADTDINEIGEKLAIVSNDNFTHLCRASIPVQTHIAIDSQTKTVTDGALFNAEYLPSESVLYTMVSAVDSRRSSYTADATKIIDRFRQGFVDEHSYLQVGGNETTGMGWCKLSDVTGTA